MYFFTFPDGVSEAKIKLAHRILWESFKEEVGNKDEGKHKPR
jgi:hypothetical protein